MSRRKAMAYLQIVAHRIEQTQIRLVAAKQGQIPWAINMGIIFQKRDDNRPANTGEQQKNQFTTIAMEAGCRPERHQHTTQYKGGADINKIPPANMQDSFSQQIVFVYPLMKLRIVKMPTHP